jgi:hypothetical protein
MMICLSVVKIIIRLKGISQANIEKAVREDRGNVFLSSSTGGIILLGAGRLF